MLAKLLNPLPAWQGVDFAYVLEVHESLADAESGTPAAERLFIKDATVAYVQGTGEFSGQLTGCKLGILQPWPSIHVQGGQSRIFSQSLRARARGSANYSSFSDMLVFWVGFCFAVFTVKTTGEINKKAATHFFSTNSTDEVPKP